MMARKLSLSQKRQLLTFLIERDGGFKCFYCKKSFKDPHEPIYEHLNDDWNDDREDNLILSHQSCNIKKSKQPNHEFANMAADKLEQTESQLFVGENFLEKKSPKSEASNEITISNKCYAITVDFITNNVLNNGWILYNETLHSIVYLCREKVGHGSVQQIRSHIYTLTSEVAPFEIAKHPKTNKKIIKKKDSD